MSRNTPSQLIAGLCLLLAAYPLWYWFAAWVSWPQWTAFALTGIGLVLGCIAWLHRRYGFALERQSLLLAGTVARLAAAAIGAGAWFSMHGLLSTAGAIVCGVIAGGIYLIAWEMLRFPTEMLLTAYALILVCAAWFVGILLCFLMGSTPIAWYAFLMLLGTVGAFTALHSLFSLQKTAEGRDVPGGFYGYNALLLGGFLAISGAVLLGSNALVVWIGHAAAAVFRYLKKMAMWVTALILQGEIYKLEDDEEQTGEVIQSGPVWLGYLIEGAVILAVVLLLWRFRREFADFIKQIVSGALQTLRHLASLKAPEPVPEEHVEYTDSVELLTAGRTSLKRRYDPLKEARRRYRRLTDPREKYRAGYAVWLLEIKERGAEYPCSAVPKKILDASGGIPDQSKTAHMTELYYRIRYGTHSPSPAELQELDSILKEIRGLRKWKGQQNELQDH